MPKKKTRAQKRAAREKRAAAKAAAQAAAKAERKAKDRIDEENLERMFVVIKDHYEGVRDGEDVKEANTLSEGYVRAVYETLSTHTRETPAMKKILLWMVRHGYPPPGCTKPAPATRVCEEWSDVFTGEGGKDDIWNLHVWFPEAERADEVPSSAEYVLERFNDALHAKILEEWWPKTKARTIGEVLNHPNADGLDPEFLWRRMLEHCEAHTGSCVTRAVALTQLFPNRYTDEDVCFGAMKIPPEDLEGGGEEEAASQTYHYLYGGK